MTTPAVITSLITDRPLCVGCIGATAGVSDDVAQAILLTLAGTLQVVSASRRCRHCDRVQETFMVATHA